MNNSQFVIKDNLWRQMEESVHKNSYRDLLNKYVEYMALDSVPSDLREESETKIVQNIGSNLCAEKIIGFKFSDIYQRTNSNINIAYDENSQFFCLYNKNKKPSEKLYQELVKSFNILPKIEEFNIRSHELKIKADYMNYYSYNRGMYLNVNSIKEAVLSNIPIDEYKDVIPVAIIVTNERINIIGRENLDDFQKAVIEHINASGMFML